MLQQHMPAGWTNQSRGEGIYPQGGPISRGERAFTFRVDQSNERRGYRTSSDFICPRSPWGVDASCFHRCLTRAAFRPHRIEKMQEEKVKQGRLEDQKSARQARYLVTENSSSGS
eukprot:5392497-Pyramimonas_sp.AAC.1